MHQAHNWERDCLSLIILLEVHVPVSCTAAHVTLEKPDCNAGSLLFLAGSCSLLHDQSSSQKCFTSITDATGEQAVCWLQVRKRHFSPEKPGLHPSRYKQVWIGRIVRVQYYTEGKSWLCISPSSEVTFGHHHPQSRSEEEIRQLFHGIPG